MPIELVYLLNLQKELPSAEIKTGRERKATTCCEISIEEKPSALAQLGLETFIKLHARSQN